MKRGEVWTAAAGEYLSKPRPVLIIQSDGFDATESVTVCAFTTDPTEAPLFRVRVEPTPENGLLVVSQLMADKVTTIHRNRLGRRVGELRADDMIQLNRALATFLGLSERRSAED